MRHTILSVSLLIISFHLYSQRNTEQIILENLIEIKSVNPNDTDFEDLYPIGDAIGNAEIVFLGEQDHGDATTFEAKTRIIKYLHQEKGFDVLAFESDFFNINKKSDNNASIQEIEKSIFSIWSNCTQVNPLFNYIEKQREKKPIRISGFDYQIGQTSDKDKISYIKDITEYIESNVDITKINDYNEFKLILTNLLFFIKRTETKEAHFKKIKKKSQKTFFKVLSDIKKIIPDKNSFLFISLENCEYYAKMAWNRKGYLQQRDLRMGENIVWLKKIKFPTKKIIIWCHSYHSVRNFNHISAGQYVYNKIESDKIYSIAFTSRKGKTKRTSINKKQKEYTIKLPEKHSFESWVHSMNMNFAFINFKKLENNLNPFYMKGVSHNSIKTNWLKSFDGVFYIERMFPCLNEKK